MLEGTNSPPVGVRLPAALVRQPGVSTLSSNAPNTSPRGIPLRSYCAVKNVSRTFPLSPSKHTNLSGFPVFSFRAI